MAEVSVIVGFFLLAAGAAYIKDSVVIGFGKCPKPSSKADFLLDSYLGTWYEYERFDNFFQRGLKCVFAEYTDTGNGKIGVRNGGVGNENGQLRTVDAVGEVVDPSKPGELKVSFSRFDTSSDANYIVVDTDYTSYAVVFSCFKVPFIPINMQTAWILTRTPGVAPSNLDALKDRLLRDGIRSDKLKSIDQTGCNK